MNNGYYRYIREIILSVRCASVKCASVKCASVKCLSVKCPSVKCPSVKCPSVKCPSMKCPSVKCMCVGKMCVSKMSVAKISVGKMSVGKMSGCGLYTQSMTHWLFFTSTLSRAESPLIIQIIKQVFNLFPQMKVVYHILLKCAAPFLTS